MIATVGATVSVPVPVPVTSREIVSPSAVKLTFTLDVVVVVGVKRTVTAWEAPTPFSVNGVPDTTVNGAEVVTTPATRPPRVFCTVNVRSAVLPIFTFP